MNKILSLILARGGSKGIKDKNIKSLNGNPLISYALKACKKSNVDDVWVSTDSKKIAEISKIYGAQVLIRPSEMSQDTSKSEEALLHFCENVDFDILVFVQCTSPLVDYRKINKGIEMIKNNNFDSVFSVTEEHWLPRWTPDLCPIDWNPSDRPRRQDKPQTFVENGSFYITTKKQLLNSGVRLGGSLGYVKIPLFESFQVDSDEDLELIERIVKTL